MRICLDLDGTICTNKKNGETYADVVPLPGAVETISKWREQGYYIILQTARSMRTQQANEGKILANMGYLYDWLKKWNIIVDEIRIGKPDCDIFIDDSAYKHINWSETDKEVQNLASRGGRFR